MTFFPPWVSILIPVKIWDDGIDFLLPNEPTMMLAINARFE